MDNNSGKPQIAIGRVPYDRPEVNFRSVEEDISCCIVYIRARADWLLTGQRTTQHTLPPTLIFVRLVRCGYREWFEVMSMTCAVHLTVRAQRLELRQVLFAKGRRVGV